MRKWNLSEIVEIIDLKLEVSRFWFFDVFKRNDLNLNCGPHEIRTNHECLIHLQTHSLSFLLSNLCTSFN